MEVQYLQSTADMWSAVRCGSHGGVKGGKMRAVLCAERCLGGGAGPGFLSLKDGIDFLTLLVKVTVIILSLNM